MQCSSILIRSFRFSKKNFIIKDFHRQFNKNVNASKAAVEIDSNEHIFAHPDYVNGLLDHRAFEFGTAYDVINRSVKLYGQRSMFSFRQTSREPFQSFTYK